MIKSGPDAYDVKWMKGRISGLPSRIRSKLQYQFYTDAQSLPVRERNSNLRIASDTARARIAPLYTSLKQFSLGYKAIATKDAVRKTAGRIAMDMYENLLSRAESLPGSYAENLQSCYLWLCEYAQRTVPEVQPPFFGEELPPSEFMEIALLKLKCDKWWCRKLLSVRKRYLETLEIVAGNVGRVSPYASKQAVTEWVRDQLATQEWAQSGELINSAGQVITLEQALAAGMGDPENMRCELMKRISGLEDYAEEMQLQGMFYTLTAPSAYHPNSKHWNGCTPKQTQGYLVNTWGKARAALDRKGVVYFGVRVTEPHKDSCPHWHMMLWCNPADAHVMNHVMRRYFCAEDRGELVKRFANRQVLRRRYRKARQLYGYAKSQGRKVKAPVKDYFPSSPRFVVEPIVTAPRDESGRRTGGAAAYIAKYIAKNINARGVEDLICEETGVLMTEHIHNVQAWKSTWNIRQFQFQGCSPITVYRELRRVRQSIEAEQIEKVRLGAESERFVDFIRAMQSVDCGLAYEVEPMANSYGEAAKRVKGVTIDNVTAWTRREKWQLRRKACSSVSAADQSWTSGNNCTQYLPDDFHRSIGLDSEAMQHLERGRTVSISGQRWRLRGNQLYEVRH